LFTKPDGHASNWHVPLTVRVEPVLHLWQFVAFPETQELQLLTVQADLDSQTPLLSLKFLAQRVQASPVTHEMQLGNVKHDSQAP
jgi:hypothetical protein